MKLTLIEKDTHCADAHTQNIYNMLQGVQAFFDESIKEHSIQHSPALFSNSSEIRVIDAYLTCLVYIFINDGED